ncbi:MAG TPA: SRPBCC family protein [Steroidobacteraceae bacterium]
MRRSSARDSCVALGLGLLAVAAPAHAFDVRSNQVTYADGVFHVVFDAVLHAPPAGIEAVLLDYSRYKYIDPRIRRAELVARESATALRVRTTIVACAGFFCRSVERVERIERAPGQLVATVIPALSDMRRGVARTRWTREADGTHVHYEAEFQPDFWVPSLIGHGLALRALRDSTAQLFRNVEHEANAR